MNTTTRPQITPFKHARKWLLAALCMFGLTPAYAELQIGQPAPSFTLPNQNGESISLNDHRGKWVVVYFYPKDDTPGCTTEACSFRDNINALIAKQAVILGISVDSIDSHEEFAKKFKLPFDLLSDEDGKVAKQYDALLNLGLISFTKRHSFIIDPQGKIARIYRNVNPQKHVAEILEELKKLQN